MYHVLGKGVSVCSRAVPVCRAFARTSGSGRLNCVAVGQKCNEYQYSQYCELTMWGHSRTYLFPISYSRVYALTYTVKSTAVLKLAQVREFYRYYLPAYVSDSPSNV
jgi:hypothetical protein